MTARRDQIYKEVLKHLDELGLLLVSGVEIPDVRRLITGKTAKGSWWSDPEAQTIFEINELLDDHSDVLLTKFICGKVTFVHRKLWREFYAVASARSDWQTRKLSEQAQRLLHKVEQEESVISNKLGSSFGSKPGDLIRELERRLLVHAPQIHTESGAHAKIIETWATWARRTNFKPRPMSVDTAQKFFETRLVEINEKYSGSGRLPWQSK